MKIENLYYRVYKPTEPVRCALFVVHGMQEHQNRYEDFAKFMCQHGVGVVTYDLPGHGKSADGIENLGWFGEKDGWRKLVDSAVQICRITKQEFPNVPVYFFGHSMGTMIGRNYLAGYDDSIDGCILSGAPSYNPAAGVGKSLAELLAKVKGKHGYSKLLDQMATGNFNRAIVSPRTPLDWLSYNDENVDQYMNDPYCGQPFTIQGYVDLFDLMIHMHKTQDYQCHRPDLPILLFAGAEDPCIGGEKGFLDTIATLQKAGYQNIEHQLYPHRRHETLKEADADEIYQDLLCWLMKQHRSDS